MVIMATAGAHGASYIMEPMSHETCLKGNHGYDAHPTTLKYPNLLTTLNLFPM